VTLQSAFLYTVLVVSLHVRVLNPNADTAMTAVLLEAATAVAAPGTIVSARNPETGPASIETHVDEAFGEVGVLRMVAASADDNVDAYVIACFGDTGRDAARDLADVPVVGMTEAALMHAALVAYRFAVVTLPVRTIAMSDRVVRHLGLAHRCVVRAVDLAVADLHPQSAPIPSVPIEEVMVAASLRAVADDGAEAIVLGCAGLSGVADAIRDACGVPVIDGVAAGVGLAESLVRQGLRTSPIGTHATVAFTETSW
jgi:allantoin racemase